MRLEYTEERPLTLPADRCAPARMHRVGYLTVLGVSPSWLSASEQLVLLIPQSIQEKSVQLQVPTTRIKGINGRTAKATGMAMAPFVGVDASGVPPRGRPV